MCGYKPKFSAAGYLAEMGKNFSDKEKWITFLEAQFILNAATIMVAHDHVSGLSGLVGEDMEGAIDGALTGRMMCWDMELIEAATTNPEVN